MRSSPRAYTVPEQIEIDDERMLLKSETLYRKEDDKFVACPFPMAPLHWAFA